MLLSRFYTWHAERLVAIVFMAVGYVEPAGVPLDLGQLIFSVNYTS